ncbi:Ig-like domain-containing protein [Desulfogranum mediterraneum]|uniref:Ig-like domain-containing protein n=1 Tax=Desulfogranum mediterraneum TaxID=160661 RepID=UPI0003FC9AED|nr:Ig-like domain-containing protein [Desulfogranum mediterraneum]
MKVSSIISSCFSLLILCMTAHAAQAAQAEFSWLPNTEPELAGYKIHYGLTSGNYTAVIDVQLPTVVDGRVSASVDGLEEGVTYFFAATAYNGEGAESDYSAEVVHSVAVTSSTEGQADFSWLPNDEADLAGYKIHYGEASLSYSQVLDVGLPATVDGRVQATVTALQPGTTYYFVATAYNGLGEESDYSAEVAYTVPSGDQPAAPVAQDLQLVTMEDNPVGGAFSVDNPSGGTLHYTIVAAPAHGTLTIHDPSGTFTYTPASDFNGADGFSYTVSNEVGVSNIANVSLTVKASNDAPVAQDDTLVIAEDLTVAGQLLATDSDGDALSFQLVSAPTRGTVSIGANGAFSYTPMGNAFGEDSFSFQASDGLLSSETAVITLTINPVNDAPTAAAGSFTVNEDASYSGQLSASDPDGGSLSYQLIATPSKGTVTVATSGAFNYTPAENVSGSDSFSFRVSDGALTSAAAVITIIINPVNDAPVVSASSFSVDQGASYNGQLGASDPDGDTLSYQLVTPPAKGSVTIGASGSFSYSCPAAAMGSDSFSFKASDAKLSSAVAVVSVTINAVNKAPVAVAGSFSVDQGRSYSGQLSASDPDGDPLSYTLVSAPASGTLQLDPSGAFSYTADADAAESDHFSFQVSDGATASNPASVTIVINELAAEFQLELGELEVSSAWQQVVFENAFSQPVLVAKMASSNDPEPAVVRIRNLSSTGFEIRIQEWNYLDDTHPAETVSFMVMEEGVHQLNEEMQAVAGCSSVSGVNNYQTISFDSPFGSQPVVMSSVVSDQGSDAVTLRTRELTPSGFELSLQEQELDGTSHVEEAICYIALQQWQGLLGNLMVEVKATDPVITDQVSVLTFSQQFTEVPLVLAAQQTANGPDTAVLGLDKLDLSGGELRVVEEASMDSETSHAAEIGGYFAVSSFDPLADSDNDGLSNGEELALPTHPGRYDTDQDGLSDGEERTYWQDNGLDLSADSDKDGLPNLVDPDSDNDGSLDGLEILEGYDPADPQSVPSELPMEVGEVAVGSELVRVAFSRSFLQPVVIANIISRNDAAPSLVRISEVDQKGFSLRIQEYGYQDDSHGEEIVSYLVIEQGEYTLSDSTRIEAGTFSTNATSAEQQTLSQQFAAAPVVMTTVMSSNDPDAVIGRVAEVSTTSFAYHLQEQEANAQSHGQETVGYLAWSAGAGSVDGLQFQAGVTPDKVSHAPYTVQFDQGANNAAPFLFAGMQTSDGPDTSQLKIASFSSTSMDILVEEEQSREPEVQHTKEVAGYLLLVTL